MMKIAIVEDDRIDLQHLSRTLEEFCSENDIPCQLDTFTEGEAFLQSFVLGKYEMIFLDNYIGDTLGVTLARHIRQEDTAADLVFVTMSPDFAVESYDIGVLHYIMKPITPDAVAKAFLRRNANRSTTAPMVELTVNRVPVRIPADSILYVDILDKLATFHCKTQVLNVYVTLDKIMELLPADSFLRPNRSCILNMDFIAQMSDHAFLLKNGAAIPASRLVWSEVKQKYMEFLLKKQQ